MIIYLSCLLFGIALDGGYNAYVITDNTGGLLHRLFTLTYLSISGIFSVALFSVRLLPPNFRWHHDLRFCWRTCPELVEGESGLSSVLAHRDHLNNLRCYYSIFCDVGTEYYSVPTEKEKSPDGG